MSARKGMTHNVHVQSLWYLQAPSADLHSCSSRVNPSPCGHWVFASGCLVGQPSLLTYSALNHNTHHTSEGHQISPGRPAVLTSKWVWVRESVIREEDLLVSKVITVVRILNTFVQVFFPPFGSMRFTWNELLNFHSIPMTGCHSHSDRSKQSASVKKNPDDLLWVLCFVLFL